MGDLQFRATSRPPLTSVKSLSPSVPSLNEAAREAIERHVRILLRCGLSRSDIAGELDRVAKGMMRADSRTESLEVAEESALTREVALATQVLSEWCTDPKYFDDEGRPLVLPKRGRRSVAALTRRISRALEVEEVIAFLIYTRTIVRSGRGYRIVRRWVSTRNRPEANSLWSLRALVQTLRTLEHNLDNPFTTPSWFHRIAERADVPVRMVPEIDRMVDRKGMAFLKWFDRYLHTCAAERQPGEPTVWYGVGLQRFESGGAAPARQRERRSKSSHPRKTRPLRRESSP
jgi:Family of unknown function (DUF6502)